jgi:hypothetical protein
MNGNRTAEAITDRSYTAPASGRVVDAERGLAALLAAFPAEGHDLVHSLPLFVAPHVLRRMFFFGDLYRLILDVPGVVLEFGTRFGRDLATLVGLRTLYEPLNHARRIVGFDTFTGFPAVDAKDGAANAAGAGAFFIGARYDAYLARVLAHHEAMAPYDHLRKCEVVAGDASETLPRYLAERPETVVALAYFDLDLYGPTRDCLGHVLRHVTRGSVLAFDQLNSAEYPGETAALREVVGLDRCRLRRFPGTNPGLPCYLVVE